MKIGIIGVCNMTLDIANRAAQSGHEVLISHTRCIESLRPIVDKMGDKVKLVTKDKAAKAKIIVLFIPREELNGFFDGLPDMSQKILLHTNNPFFNTESLSPPIVEQVKSSSEIIASLLPDAHVIKIFHVLQPELILPKCQSQNGNEVFYMGTNQQAKNKVKSFLKTLNLSACDLEELCIAGQC
jgi:predicted dinucleotide-binding enzyme